MTKKYKLAPPEQAIYKKDGTYRNPKDYEKSGEDVELVMKNEKTGHQITTKFGGELSKGLIKQLSTDAMRQFIHNNKTEK